MSNPTELLPGTSIASTSWELDNKVERRVYTQDIQGNIRESRYTEADGWTGGTSKDFVVKAKPNSPVAVFSSLEGFDVIFWKIRLYYISPDNILRELCIDASKTTWEAGNLDGLNISASPISRLAAIKACSESGTDLTLFYQRPDGAIGNIYYNGPIPFPNDFPVGWVDLGIVGHKPLFGTGLAVVPFFSGDYSTSYNRLFYQLPNGQLAAANTDWTGKWSKGDVPEITSAATATNISGWAPDFQPTSFYVYFLDGHNNAIELTYSDNQWSSPRRAGGFLPVPDSGLANTQANKDDNLRLYVQDESNVIQEYQWDKASDKWSESALIPVGPLQ